MNIECIEESLASLLLRSEGIGEDLAPIYEALGWKWSFTGGVRYVPDMQDIANTIVTLIRAIRIDIKDDPRLAKKDSYSASTGGIYVGIKEVPNGGVEATARFEKSFYDSAYPKTEKKG